MCGFAGSFSQQNELDQNGFDDLRSSLKRIAHRGPDDQGEFQHPCFSVVHARLAVIDPDARSKQPMFSSCGRYVIVFNGEIYNYLELKKTLERKQHVFITDSDTEVLLHGLIEWGPDLLPKLNGCFAFAFCDLEKASLLLARDRMGIKPLYYFRSPDGILHFSSELKALTGVTSRKINREVVNDFLHYSYTPKHESILEGVEKLPPGAMFNTRDSSECTRWYSNESTFKTPCNKANSERLYNTLEKAVQSRLIADVPVGTFLSGGIDSSIISALAARHHSSLNTFSVGFSAHQFIDESEMAQRVAQHIGSKHHQFNLDEAALIDHTEIVLNSLDEPFADASAIAVSFLAQKTREHVTVALSGDGADELFGGYRKHRAHAAAMDFPKWLALAIHPFSSLLNRFASRENRFGNQLRSIHRFISGCRLDAQDQYHFWAMMNHPRSIEHLNFHPPTDRKAQIDAATNRDLLQQVLLNDQAMVLPGDMLTKVDLFTMRHALEVRVPFLDYRVVEMANGICAAEKYDRKRGKKLLREAFSSLLPPEVFEQRKQGFEVPLEWLLRKPYAETVSALGNSEVLGAMGLSLAGIEQLTKVFLRGEAKDSGLIWALVVLERWCLKEAELKAQAN